MLEAEELKASVTDLDTGLAEVDGNDFTHVEKCTNGGVDKSVLGARV